ncbi:unnamed protein product [Rotaria socialis]|uniref:peptidyl-tRNA hydrolase n=1 Tax=Rotaria socialis TaxID=392032 RepID=A0A820XLU2_9BILA|nr:unnamed protein product [Rotaria socialis]
MSHTSWFEEKTATAGLVAGFFGGLALGWIFSSSVFLNNSVKVVSSAFDFEKDQSLDEKCVDPGSSDAEGEYKLVLVVRNDLKMGHGKIAAQCSHATLACFQKACEKIPDVVDTWFFGGQAKVVCKCESDDDLEQLRRQAKFKGLTTCLVRDVAPSRLINDIIRQLKIY